jgi:dTDP-glucose 4,6-dehydratase
MRNLLITGGAGFIGANFVHYWLSNHAQDNVVVLDALTYAGNLKNLASIQNTTNYKFIEGNILDQSLVQTIFTELNIDTVIHFAAESHVDRSIANPNDFIKTNVLGTAVLLAAAKDAWSTKKNTRFHHISTDEVYGSLGPDCQPFTENSSYSPNSPYSASKAASDHLVRAYHRTYNFPVTLSNCSNNYGPYQHFEKFIPTVIRSCLAWQPIPIYSDGSNIRDWLYVEDHCEAIDLIINNGKVGETYNIGGDNEINNLELARKICCMMDTIKPAKTSYLSLISFVKDRPGHDWRYAINATKIKSQLGFYPKTNFELGLLNTINFYLEDFNTSLNLISV